MGLCVDDFREEKRRNSSVVSSIETNKMTKARWVYWNKGWNNRRRVHYLVCRPDNEQMSIMRVSEVLTVSRNMATNLAVKCKNWKILTVSRKIC